MTSIDRFLGPPDRRSQNLLFLDNFYPTFTIVLVHMLIVLKIGPQIMKHKTPWSLQKFRIMYNILQIIFNTYLTIEGFRLLKGNNPFCGAINTSINSDTIQMAKYMHYYYLLKISDLTETVVFIMRKKFSQVTFLHCYHHGLMVIVSWIAARYYPGGQSLIVPAINAFTHVIMYIYYLLSSLNYQNSRSIWWKKYITQVQLIQHVIFCLAYTMSCVNPSCTYPKSACCIVMINAMFMVFLFGRFYVRNYLSSKKIVK